MEYCSNGVIEQKYDTNVKMDGRPSPVNHIDRK
jgi:hypothetical protein